eukprot:TRINITY_DN23955_c0_g1_i2.p1 TRINITY_DN23955_c0_g1~~TRINITY_DN23955_c0_g1_i2.p1  ORF type:complete len:787 (+),score=107.58 TRINITY_DN23955_c0_g1_i2:195-2555(+)
MAGEKEPGICKVGGTSGWFLPVSESQLSLPPWLHVLICAVLMIYCFLGVSIVADLFMNSIEAITGRRKQVESADGRYRTVKVWNETVATLSLMALGSSAPEIFLSVMDLLKRKFFFSSLGASTITGSAAFNLLVIVAVCVLVIPSDEVRQISDLPSFYVTAVFSCFAYVWLVVILEVISPQIVDVWEAIVTFLLLFVLVWLSYKVNVGDFDVILRLLNLVEAKQEDVGVESRNHPCIGFLRDHEVVQGTAEKHAVVVVVTIPEGVEAQVNCSYRTEPLTAVPGYDYEDTEGTIEFVGGTLSQEIALTVLPKADHKQACSFLLILEDVTGGDVEFDSEADGGEDSAIFTVVITPSCSSRRSWRSAVNAVVNVDGLCLSLWRWRDLFTEALYCDGSSEAQQEASCQDFAVHIVSLPWKLLWTIIPPPVLFGGWAAFYASLGGIAFLSAILSDLAEMFGCVLQVDDIVTAITFVALGTSMPDLFASLQAAKDDPTADAAIVNVTGSNSVNVFLGLGLPWSLGAIYWQATGRTEKWNDLYAKNVGSWVPSDEVAFVVDSNGVAFSVVIFIITCVVALFILFVRRKAVGGELGGNYRLQVLTFLTFIILWLSFISIVGWRMLRGDDADRAETATVYAVVATVTFTAASYNLLALMMHWRNHKWRRMSIECKAGNTTSTSTPIKSVMPEEDPVAGPHDAAGTSNGSGMGDIGGSISGPTSTGYGGGAPSGGTGTFCVGDRPPLDVLPRANSDGSAMSMGTRSAANEGPIADVRRMIVATRFGIFGSRAQAVS